MDYNRMNTESKKTRIRRTNEQVDKAISDALTTLAGQMPLARITVNQLIAEAGIEAAVFFKRYSSIDDLIYEYVRDHDFWLGETVSYRKMDKEGAERYYIRTLEDLCRHLDSNGPLRDSLLWELASDSEAVKKIADIRELENESLLAYYRKYFKGTGLDISGVTAVLIAGIYYLYLHRGKSTFCGLDLNTEKDSRRLLRLLSRTVHTLFAEAGKSTSDDSVRNPRASTAPPSATSSASLPTNLPPSCPNKPRHNRKTTNYFRRRLFHSPMVPVSEEKLTPMQCTVRLSAA